MEDNNEQDKTFTLGIWNVKPGKETEFINEWTSFANWTKKSFAGSGKPYLLQDEKDSSRFISFGPWDSHESIQKWRASSEFKDFVVKVRELCDDFQPNTLKVASTLD